MSILGPLRRRGARRRAVVLSLAVAGLSSAAAAGSGTATSDAVVACPACPPQTCTQMGRLRVFAGPAVRLTPRNQFVVRACTGRSERATVVLRRAGRHAILSRRSVLLNAGRPTSVVLKTPDQHETRYRVTIGVGDVHADVVVRVRPAREPVRID